MVLEFFFIKFFRIISERCIWASFPGGAFSPFGFEFYLGSLRYA
jgi:hypothetical protein